MNTDQRRPDYSAPSAKKLALGAGLVAGVVAYFVNVQDLPRAAKAQITVTVDMGTAFRGIPSVVRPGQVLTGLTLTCADASGGGAATACVPTASVGTIGNVVCRPTSGSNVAAVAPIACTFDFTAPGTLGGTDEPVTAVTFTGTTGATNVTAPATMIDAVNDAVRLAGGMKGQTADVATNDQFPVASIFSLVSGGTCASSSVSTTGTATFNVPASGTCTVPYQVCAAAPNGTTCDTATLTVTAGASDSN